MITTSQIRNVLRVYGNQLKRINISVQDRLETEKRPPDMVDISFEAKRRQMLSQISNNLLAQITPKGDERKTHGYGNKGNPSQGLSEITEKKEQL